MSKHDQDEINLNNFHFRGKGISRSEEKQINLFLGRAILGVLGFAVISSIFAVATGRDKVNVDANYLTREQVTKVKSSLSKQPIKMK